MNLRLLAITTSMLLACALDSSPLAAASARKTPDGKKWKIAYYEGGPYINYTLHLKSLVKALSKLGWVEKTTIPDSEIIPFELMPKPGDPGLDRSDSVIIWKWLAKHLESDCIQFSGRACWSANWVAQRREANRKEALAFLKTGDADLIIAMGTWAGQDLANHEHAVPTLVMSTSDPVRAKIIKSPGNSGYPHVHAKCDPSRYLRQIRLFHAIIGFKNLGVVYENTPEGRTYASVKDIEQVARERDFEVLYCEAPFSEVERDTSTESVIKCHEKLGQHVDAVYVTVHRGIEIDSMDEILAPLIRNKIPTFSQRGILEVQHGVLYGVDRESFDNLGTYYAEAMVNLLQGLNATSLKQIYEDPKKIVINLDTARKIGYEPPPNILKVTDIIYGNK